MLPLVSLLTAARGKDLGPEPEDPLKGGKKTEVGHQYSPVSDTV